MIDSTYAIQTIRNNLETLIAVYHIAAECKESDDTISFYIYKDKGNYVQFDPKGK